ncbi:S1 family peptidase [Rhizobacter fulvus]
MPGLVRERLVMIQATVAGPEGGTHVGTGYLIDTDLVLTASHVVPDHVGVSIEVRVEKSGGWLAVAPVPVWRDSSLDAMLLRLVNPSPELAPVDWVDTEFGADVEWESGAYPDAATVDLPDGTTGSKTSTLKGQLYALGGGGQGARELELTVEAHGAPAGWAGISGAPVFVGNRLAGIVKEVAKGFEGARLAAVPSTALLQSHGFLLAVTKPWLEPFPAGVWVLVVHADVKKAQTSLAGRVDNALTTDASALESVLGSPLHPKALRVHIGDAIASPGRWLHFVKALCAAPIAVFDATDFDQPAIMLAMGVRAVVRRGVTLTSTAKELTSANLSKLPFNIQETKLIYHGSKYEVGHPQHPATVIPAAIKRGWQERASLPDYLDLPAYDAVRCPYPSVDVDGRSAIDHMLMLCSFSADHEPHWLRLSNALLDYYPTRKPARTLDIASPRLVGQALYEGIRWARTCVIDWTGWRANVFFELGVRMACADIGPVNLIEQPEFDAAMAAEPGSQKRQLIDLLGPTAYLLDLDAAADVDVDAVSGALERHDSIVEQRPPVVGAGALPHDATFRTCRDFFDWKQEEITKEPHALLRTSIEAPYGKDPQAAGRKPLLFSDNVDYGKELERSVKERWIAAWCYLANRYPRAQWADDAPLRTALRKLGNDVLQFGFPRRLTDPHLVELQKQIRAALKELRKLDP